MKSADTSRAWISALMVVVLITAACGGSADSASPTGSATEPGAGQSPATTTTVGPGGQGPSTSEDSQSAPSGEAVALDGADFQLCPVLIEHGDELAGILNLNLDPERGVEQTFDDECNFTGANPGDFARVERGRSFDGSVEGYMDTIDSDGLIVTHAIEMGSDALYASDGFRAYVAFSLGDRLVIGVSAVVEKPDLTTEPEYDTMIAFATRVRDLLIEANS